MRIALICCCLFHASTVVGSRDGCKLTVLKRSHRSATKHRSVFLSEADIFGYRPCRSYKYLVKSLSAIKVKAVLSVCNLSPKKVFSSGLKSGF